jgi:hypothetical protein
MSMNKIILFGMLFFLVSTVSSFASSTVLLIKSLVFTPLTLGMSYIEAKLARGGG